MPVVQSDSLAGMRRSLVPAETTQLTGRRIGGSPVYAYVRNPGAPAISVLRFSAAEPRSQDSNGHHPHAHDFLVLAYFERGAGSIGLDDQEWAVAAGDAFVIAPGEVVGMGRDGHGSAAEGWGVFFGPEIIASGELGWRAHPLLFPFVARSAGGAQRLRVPPGEQAAWTQHVAAIERELHEPRDGSGEAALAHLTLLLVSVARISTDLGHDLRLRAEPLLAAVFEFIEEHYTEPISLADVGAAVGLTPGHLTTVVRRKTGRTVQRWISERRMAEARRLLRQTDLTVEVIAARTGHRQPSFFIKQFRRDHSTTPAAWRRAERRG
jgi:AraC family transcriptional activator of pobA